MSFLWKKVKSIAGYPGIVEQLNLALKTLSEDETIKSNAQRRSDAETLVKNAVEKLSKENKQAFIEAAIRGTGPFIELLKTRARHEDFAAQLEPRRGRGCAQSTGQASDRAEVRDHCTLVRMDLARE